MDGLVVTDKIPKRLPAMPKNVLTAAARKRLDSRKRLTPFNRYSRVINLFKPCHQAAFCEWVDRQQERGLLILTDGETASNITSLHFNYQAHARHRSGKYSKTSTQVFAKGDVYLALAELLTAVGGAAGLEHNLMVMYRYISSPVHSNLGVDYKALKRQISSISSGD